MPGNASDVTGTFTNYHQVSELNDLETQPVIGQYGHIPLRCGASDTGSRIANKKCFYNFGSTSKYHLATLFNRLYIQKITIQLSFNEK